MNKDVIDRLLTEDEMEALEKDLKEHGMEGQLLNTPFGPIFTPYIELQITTAKSPEESKEIE